MTGKTSWDVIGNTINWISLSPPVPGVLATSRAFALFWRSMPRHLPSASRFWICVLSLLPGCAVCSAQIANSVGAKREGSPFEDLLKKGFDLHRQARFAEAIPVLERARGLEPKDYFANLLLGIDLIRTGKPGEAVPRLQLAARVRPDEETPEEYLGEAQAALGRYAQAAEAYRVALVRGHDSGESLEAWAGFALERFRQIGEGLRGSPAGVETVERLQRAAAKPSHSLACQQPVPALERQFASSGTGAEHLEVGYKLSICYALEAGKAAERLQSGAKDDAAVHRLRGDVLLRIKTDAAAAVEEYRAAIAARPGDPASLARLGQAQLAAGDTEAAKQSSQAALSIDPHRIEALHTLASLAMSSRDYEQALPWLRQIVAASPGDQSAQVELARALAQTGQSADALRYLAPALASSYPDEKGALHALEARVLRDLGRDEEAARASAEARRLSDAFQARSKNSAEAKPNADQ
jgi:predicted Zn-dependent protease